MSTAIASPVALTPPAAPASNETVDALVARGISTDLVRISTAGSVDDGKSTLIGRLLFDSKSVFTDHAANATKLTTSETVKLAGQPLDYSLLVDGLAAEREQGITIDVAYRYFSTARRRFIIADTPGHEQYTRNMATGASTADVAVILVDARKGVLVQSRRHAFIASLLGIRHVVVAVNKMDLAGWSSEVFARIRADFRDFAVQLGIPDIRYVPVSALLGDNVVTPSSNTPWYLGRPLLETLETLDVRTRDWLGDPPAGFRLPVQLVIRPDLDFRGYAGQVAAGEVKPGDRVTVLPSKRTTTVTRVIGPSSDLGAAVAPQSVTLTLADEIDISRGDMIVAHDDVPPASRTFESMVVWLTDQPLIEGQTYLLKHTTRTVKATVQSIRAGIDVNSGERRAAASVPLNGIAQVVLRTAQPLFVDAYRRNRSTGAFILIDPQTHATAGAGMVTANLTRETQATPRPVARNLTAHRGLVSRADHAARTGVAPLTLWFTGLSGSGKSTIAYALERQLFDEGIPVAVLDGDNVRHGLSRDLGFSECDRRENIRRVAETARLMNDAGVVVIVSLISPLASDRALAREIVGADAFREVHVATAIEVCRARDPKGLYRKADAGEIAGFTGVSAPYEAPQEPALRIDGDRDMAAWVARVRALVTRTEPE